MFSLEHKFSSSGELERAKCLKASPWINLSRKYRGKKKEKKVKLEEKSCFCGPAGVWLLTVLNWCRRVLQDVANTLWHHCRKPHSHSPDIIRSSYEEIASRPFEGWWGSNSIPLVTKMAKTCPFLLTSLFIRPEVSRLDPDPDAVLSGPEIIT